MARLALKVAYDGTCFSGSQVQPDRRTVHGDLARALADLDLPHERITWAGRTDAGVSARGNVAVVDGLEASPTLLRSLSFALEDACVWAYADVAPDFEPRHAHRRRYRYHLRTDLPAKAVESALARFVGTHDFSRFARIEPGVNPVRTIESIHVNADGDLLAIDIAGPNFLWNQVRRMVAAARAVAAGEATEADLDGALAGEGTRDLGIAAPEPLVLMDVEHPHVAWHEPTSRERERLFGRLKARHAEAARHAAVLHDLLETS